MRFVNIKGPDIEKALPGITADVEVHNGSIQSVTLKGADGGVVKFTMNSYTFTVLGIEPPKKEKRFRVTGEVLGGSAMIDVLKKDKYDADRMVSDACSNGDTLKIEEVEVEVPAD